MDVTANDGTQDTIIVQIHTDSVHPPIVSLAETERRTQELMEKVVELGYGAVKLQLVYGDVYSDADIVRLVKMARRVLGEQMTFMLDVGYRWLDSKAAARTLQQLEECNLYFVSRMASSSCLRRLGSECG